MTPFIPKKSPSSQMSKTQSNCSLALTPVQMEFYDQVVNEYFGEDGRFTGAIYQPFVYEEQRRNVDGSLDEAGNRTYQQQRNLYDFMRRLLVKRFESSFGAFARSMAISSVSMNRCWLSYRTQAANIFWIAS